MVDDGDETRSKIVVENVAVADTADDFIVLIILVTVCNLGYLAFGRRRRRGWQKLC